MFDLPTQQIRACDGSAPLAKPSKNSGSNARKKRVAETAEAPVVIKPKAEKPVRAKIGARLRAMVLERDGFKCVRCGAMAATGSTLHIDHIIPVAQGGNSDESNLQTLCFRCNIGKGARREPIDNSKIVSQLAAIVGKKPKIK